MRLFYRYDSHHWGDWISGSFVETSVFSSVWTVWKNHSVNLLSCWAAVWDSSWSLWFSSLRATTSDSRSSDASVSSLGELGEFSLISCESLGSAFSDFWYGAWKQYCEIMVKIFYSAKKYVYFSNELLNITIPHPWSFCHFHRLSNHRFAHLARWNM